MNDNYYSRNQLEQDEDMRQPGFQLNPIRERMRKPQWHKPSTTSVALGKIAETHRERPTL